MMARSEDLHEDRPAGWKAALLSIVALMGLSSAAQLVAWTIFVDDFVWASAEGRRVMIVLPVSLVIGGAALWGLLRLNPWRGPISPRTRRTYTLAVLSVLVSAPGALVIFFDAFSRENPYGFYSNSTLSPGIAIFAITSWLLAIAIAWRWYCIADEHEQRANDFGFLAGGGVFMAVTPVWWVAARAQLVPPPDAMVLWCITLAVMAIGWLWHRYR